MHVLHGVVSCVRLYVWDVHYVYLHLIEENALVFAGCGNRSGVCTQRKKGRSKDR